MGKAGPDPGRRGNEKADLLGGNLRLDVLEGVDEFFGAADLLGLRVVSRFESRVFFKEYADAEINSPGEPGVFYFMGFGFVGKPEPGSKAEAILDDMLERSHSRNRAVIARINAKLDAFQLDYDEDVLPLTPKGNATERHICVALHEKALRTLGSEAAAAKFWQGVFGCKAEDVVAKIGNANAFTDMLRSKLIKRGGVGYQQPEESTFLRWIPLCHDQVLPRNPDDRMAGWR